MRCWRK